MYRDAKPAMLTRKGQLGITDLIVFLFDLAVFFFVFVPLYTPFATTAISSLNSSWPFYGATTDLIYVIPFLILVCFSLVLLHRAQGPSYG